MVIDKDEWETDRDKAFRSGDKEIFLAYLKKYEAPIPENDLLLWTAYHKGRLALPGMNAAEQAVSREWLSQQGIDADFADFSF
jgi:hypothetical protein